VIIFTLILYFLSILLYLHIVTFLMLLLVIKSHIESVDSVCRDSVDPQYMIISQNLKNGSNFCFIPFIFMTSVGGMVNSTLLVTGG